MTKQKAVERAQKIYTALRQEGFDTQQIEDAMCDGEYLGDECIPAEIAHEVWRIARRQTRKRK